MWRKDWKGQVVGRGGCCHCLDMRRSVLKEGSDGSGGEWRGTAENTLGWNCQGLMRAKAKRRVMRSLYPDEATDFITSSKSMASLVHRIHHFSR